MSKPASLARWRSSLSFIPLRSSKLAASGSGSVSGSGSGFSSDSSPLHVFRSSACSRFRRAAAGVDVEVAAGSLSLALAVRDSRGGVPAVRGGVADLVANRTARGGVANRRLETLRRFEEVAFRAVVCRVCCAVAAGEASACTLDCCCCCCTRAAVIATAAQEAMCTRAQLHVPLLPGPRLSGAAFSRPQHRAERQQRSHLTTV